MDGYLRVCRRCGEEEEAVLIRSRRSSEVDGGEVRLICLPVCPGGGACAGLGGAFSLVSGRFIASAKRRGKKLAWLVGLKFKLRP